MNDIRRTFLWVIFGFSMVLLWDNWQVHNGKPATFFPTPAKPAASATTLAGLALIVGGIETVWSGPVSSGPGRAPAEANELIEWMRAHEQSWRG